MIEIISDEIEMPKVSDRRFQKKCNLKNNQWYVLDVDSEQVVCTSTYENVSLACHNLNKENYRILYEISRHSNKKHDSNM